MRTEALAPFRFSIEEVLGDAGFVSMRTEALAPFRSSPRNAWSELGLREPLRTNGHGGTLLAARSGGISHRSAYSQVDGVASMHTTGAPQSHERHLYLLRAATPAVAFPLAGSVRRTSSTGSTPGITDEPWCSGPVRPSPARASPALGRRWLGTT